MKFIQKIKLLPVVIFSLYILVGAIKQVSAKNGFLGIESKGVIFEWIEIIILILFIFTVVLNSIVIRKFGKSIPGLPFIYILVGLTFMELSRIFISLYNFNVYTIDEVTLQFGWHILFYIGMVACFFAIRGVNERRKDEELQGFGRRDIIVILVLAAITIAALTTVKFLDPWFSSWFEGSIWDTFGILHFIAFILATYLTIELLRIRTRSSESDLGKLLSSFIPSFLIFLAIMSLNHLWELLTESWAVLPLDEEIIETGEQIFWLPAFLITALGFRSVIKTSQLIFGTDIEDLDLSNVHNPLLVKILEVLNYHLGADSEKIAIQSGNSLGIKITEIKPESVPDFGNEVQNLTKDLIGDFPSRFLNQAIQKAVST